jgi:hypothetical protein
MTDEPNVEINLTYAKKKLKSLQIRCGTCHTEVYIWAVQVVQITWAGKKYLK